MSENPCKTSVKCYNKRSSKEAKNTPCKPVFRVLFQPGSRKECAYERLAFHLDFRLIGRPQKCMFACPIDGLFGGSWRSLGGPSGMIPH